MQGAEGQEEAWESLDGSPRRTRRCWTSPRTDSTRSASGGLSCADREVGQDRVLVREWRAGADGNARRCEPREGGGTVGVFQ